MNPNCPRKKEEAMGQESENVFLYYSSLIPFSYFVIPFTA
jgi:hypothetical protein